MRPRLAATLIGISLACAASAQGHWTPANGPMTTPRDAETAVQIGDRVLLIGGRMRASGRTTGAVEWILPTDMTAWPAAQMSGSRSFCPAVVLPDGTLLLPGGFRQIRHDTTLRSAEVFDPKRGRWRTVGNLLDPRELHTATVLPDATVLLAGGFSNGKILDTAEIYLPSRNRFARTGSLHTARFGHTAIAVPSGILVLGGRTSRDRSLATTERYNFQTRTWTEGPAMAQDRFRHTSTLLQDGRVLLTGGYSSTARKTLDTAEIYDPAAGTFTLLASRMTDGRMDHTATLLVDGRVLVCGGWCSTKGRTVASADLFDPHTNTFTPAPPLPASRHEHAAIGLPNGGVLIAGGLRVEPGVELTLDDLEIYTP
jgi:hypothetical protein